MPWLLRLAHVKSQASGHANDSAAALQAREHSRPDCGFGASALGRAGSVGLLAWRASLERGLLPDDSTLLQLVAEGDDFARAATLAGGPGVDDGPSPLLQWPEEPLRTMLLRALGKLGVSRLCKKYPAVRDALLVSVLATVLRFNKALAGIEELAPEREKDINGQIFMTAAELMQQEAERRAATKGGGGSNAQQRAAAAAAASEPRPSDLLKAAVDSVVAASGGSLARDRATALVLVKQLFLQWSGPVETLSRAGRAFDGLEALLGGDGFDLGGGIWSRPGWVMLDSLRKKLEELKELRDLVRSLGRGGGWGPLRRAPVQRLDMNKGRPGLMRTVLEAQETRGLTRSGDISRLLPAEAALLARGRTVRQAKLLFYARLAEQGLQTYERDGWGEYPTDIIPERREIRPTADRGPILLCVDTSGSMRGPRETVAKALALECMRAARQQERNCYVFAFAGLSEVRELQLNMDTASVNNLLQFLETMFNGGSDFNEPVRRCLDRLHDAKWANSDILLVSDGELRQPTPDIMRKLSGAKEALGLRVHGLIVGSPEKKRADPAVLRALCTNYLPNGKVQVQVSSFEGWASVQAEAAFQMDWDDTEGKARRRLASLAHEKRRQEEARRKRVDAKSIERSAKGSGVLKVGVKKF